MMWGLYRFARPPAPDRVVVTTATVAALEERFEQQRGRAPSEAELDALVDDWIEREILVREARARGLDRADPIVRRRLAQTMKFALEDAETAADPGDATLQAWMQQQDTAYRRAPRRGFVQVFVPGRVPASEAQARQLADALREGADPATLGGSFVHGRRQAPAEHDAIARRYGEPFAQAIDAMSRDTWTVVSSSFGWHIVRLDEERPGQRVPLAEIRARVLADWRVEQRAQGLERGLEQLRARYEIEVPR